MGSTVVESYDVRENSSQKKGSRGPNPSSHILPERETYHNASSMTKLLMAIRVAKLL